MKLKNLFKKSKNVINDNGLNLIFNQNGKGDLLLQKFYKKNGVYDGEYEVYSYYKEIRSDNYCSENSKSKFTKLLFRDTNCYKLYNNGDIIKEINFLSKEKPVANNGDGFFRRYDFNGNILKETSFKNGIRLKEKKIYKSHIEEMSYKNDELIIVDYFSLKGNLIATSEYLNSKINSLKILNDIKVLKEREYDNGNLIGDDGLTLDGVYGDEGFDKIKGPFNRYTKNKNHFKIYFKLIKKEKILNYNVDKESYLNYKQKFKNNVINNVNLILEHINLYDYNGIKFSNEEILNESDYTNKTAKSITEFEKIFNKIDEEEFDKVKNSLPEGGGYMHSHRLRKYHHIYNINNTYYVITQNASRSIYEIRNFTGSLNGNNYYKGSLIKEEIIHNSIEKSEIIPDFVDSDILPAGIIKIDETTYNLTSTEMTVYNFAIEAKMVISMNINSTSVEKAKTNLSKAKEWILIFRPEILNALL